MNYLWHIILIWYGKETEMYYLVTNPCSLTEAVDILTEDLLEGWSLNSVKLLSKDVLIRNEA